MENIRPVIRLETVTLGYCHNCGLPQKVGTIFITGWKHEVNICDSCLKEIAQKIILFNIGA